MRLQGKHIAMFIADIYEDLEFWYPYYRMKEEGAEVTIIGSGKKSYTGKNGVPAQQDIAISEADPGKFDALIIPGGYAPDRMRRQPAMVDFIKKIDQEGKVIAAICHAAWMLVSANVLKDKQATSFFSIKDDVVNAGAVWVDEEVVTSGNLITSRKPDDLPSFCRVIIDALSG